MKRLFAPGMLAMGCLIVPALAQQPVHLPHVGYLSPGAASFSPGGDAFKKGLAELGYVEGKNFILEQRFAEGKYERFPQLAADLASQKVDVVFLIGAVTAQAAMKAIPDIPIVFAVVVDPVAVGMVKNMERPGGNVTGMITFDPQQPRRQLELLKEAIPGVRTVAILDDAGVAQFLNEQIDQQARALGLQTRLHRIAAAEPRLEEAFAAMREEHADAVLVQEVPLLAIHRKTIAQLAAKQGLPTLFPPSSADAGGVIAYGVSLNKAVPRAAVYVDKILKGAKPGELPVERVIPYELIVNQQAARGIGVTIPAGLLKRADRVIE